MYNQANTDQDNIIGHLAAPGSTDLHPLIAFYHHNTMDSLSKEERVQLALKAFNYGRNDTPCSLTFISSLQASLGKGESFFGVEDYTKIWIGSFMGPVVFMARYYDEQNMENLYIFWSL